MSKTKVDPLIEMSKALMAVKQSNGAHQRQVSKGVDALNNLAGMGPPATQGIHSLAEELRSLAQMAIEGYREINKLLDKITANLNTTTPALAGSTNNRKETENATIE